MKNAVSLCLALLISSLLALTTTPLAALADTYQGTWIANPANDGRINIELNYRHRSGNDDESWSDSFDEPQSALRDMTSGGFTLVRDAGDFRASGALRNGEGQGTWVFVPSATFVRALAQRGMPAPSEHDQFALAMARFSIASLDQLLSAGFERPTVRDLVRMGNHGVDPAYIAAFRGANVTPKTVDGLIRMRDHGVTPQFADAMSRMGYRPSAEDLIRLIDHGVSIAFIEKMRAHGYAHLSTEDLIRLRDHGF